MSGPKCNLPEAERAGILAQFPAFLTQEEEDTIRDMFPQYLFFRNEYEDDGFNVSSTPVRMCTCTACGETFSAVRGNWARGKLHHEMCNCPNCGRDVEGIAVRKYKYSLPSLAQWGKTAVLRVLPDGALQIEAGNALRRFTHDDLVGEIVWRPERRYYFKAGTVQAWTLRITEWSCDGNHRYEWLPLKTVPDAFAPNFMAGYNGGYVIIGLREAFEHPAWKYCQMETFYHYQYAADIIEDWTTGQRAESARRLVLYLAWYALHPQIEMAVKLGLSDAVEELIENNRKNARLLNWDADTPVGFLRMDKRDAKAFIWAQMSFRDLKTWRGTDKKGSFADYIALADLVGGAENLQKISERANVHGIALKTAARYITKLIPACSQYAPPTAQIIQTWCDYLDMARSLNYDLTEETVLMPKNLQERHDTAAETLGELNRFQDALKQRNDVERARADAEEQLRRIKAELDEIEKRPAATVYVPDEEAIAQAANAAAEAERAKHEKAEKELREQIAALTGQVKTETGTREKLEKQLREAEEKEAAAKKDSAEAEALRGEIDGLRKQLALAAPEVADFKAAFGRAQEELNHMLDAIARIGDEKTRAKLKKAGLAMMEAYAGRLGA